MDSPVSSGITTGTIVGGRYAIESLLGRGGMATVYRATDTALGRSVAVKLFAANDEGAADLGRETSEIRLLASLNHHALVTLFDASVDTGAVVDQPYLVMELVEGPTLKERVQAAPIAETDIALMVSELAEALHVVHEAGVVHRDIKPANILLSRSASPAFEFRAKLSDFGIAYLIDSTRLTTPGMVIGTAAYLSPEQARGLPPGAASDIYSLGLVALEALTGARAFEGSMVETLSARLVSDPVIPSSVASDWRALLAAMTTREPAERPTALETADLARRIERSLHPVEVTGERPTRVMEVAPATDATDATDATAVLGATVPRGSTGALGATEAMSATEALGATAALGATEALGTTQALGATEALGATAAPESADPTLLLAPTADATERLSARDATAPPRARTRLGKRVAIVAAGAVVVAGIAVAGFSLAAPEAEAPRVTPTLPAIDGDLGTHLDDLLESVTP